tara:strand:+ start:2429 stop:2977 length:549 start_codon:yes stop_codon:yes gene_type:complete
MSSFEFNKILAAIFVAIIVLIIIGKAGDFIVKIEKDGTKETAYKIDIPAEENIATESETNKIKDIKTVSILLASASLENGEKIYKKCGTCHNYKKDSKSKVGPNLWDIINRPKGYINGYAYSSALVNSGGVWTFEELNKFLYKPKEYISGTKMNFAGLKKVEDRADLILWLRENSDNPVPLP